MYHDCSKICVKDIPKSDTTFAQVKNWYIFGTKTAQNMYQKMIQKYTVTFFGQFDYFIHLFFWANLTHLWAKNVPLNTILTKTEYVIY